MLFIVKAPKMSPSLTLLSNQNRKKAKSGLYWPLIKKNIPSRGHSRTCPLPSHQVSARLVQPTA